MILSKEQLLTSLLAEIEKSLEIATRAANDAKDLATHEQSKPETQYDTVGLEASYLAHGQSQRVAELKLALLQWQKLRGVLIDQHKPIEFGSLIQLQNDNGDSSSSSSSSISSANVNNHASWFLLGPAMGGLKLKQNNNLITVITDSSPLGKLLIGKYLDDEITLTLQGKKIDYEIVAIA
jgi:transcription elongation GreA/GreB family factor